MLSVRYGYSSTEEDPCAPPVSRPLEAPYDRRARRGARPLHAARRAAARACSARSRTTRACSRKFRLGSLLDRGSLSPARARARDPAHRWRCGSEYEWGVHVTFFARARRASPTREVRATCAASCRPTACSRSATRDPAPVRRAARSADVDDALLAELAAEFATAQLVELIVLAGFYHTVVVRHERAAHRARAFRGAFPA